MARKKKSGKLPKLEHNWKSKTIEALEKDYWGEPEYDSYLVTTCHKLRKKQLKDFETEDLRIMIGQNIGLLYLIPLALEVLERDILAEGDFYKGDLLKVVMTSTPEFWKNDAQKWKQMCELFERNKALLDNCDTTKTIKNGWFEAYSAFEKIN